MRMLRVEANLVRRSIDSRGAAGFVYKCLKCGQIKRERLRAIGHAANCGRKRTGKKRGKSTKVLQCSLCKETANTVKKLRQHRKEFHGQALGQAKFQCTRCLKSFSHLKNYRLHMKLHMSSVRKFKCGKCPLTFNYLRNMKRHKLSHLHMESQTGSKFSCPTCGKTFLRQDSLRRHIRSHQGPEVGPVTLIKCSHCKEQFTRRDSLRRHQSRKHLGTGVESNQVDDGGAPHNLPPLTSDIIEVLRSSGYDEETISRLVEKYTSSSNPNTTIASLLTSSASSNQSHLTSSGDPSVPLADPSPAPPHSSTSSEGPGTGSKWDQFLSPSSSTLSTYLKQSHVCQTCGDSRDPFRDSYSLARHIKNVHCAWTRPS